VISPTTQYLDDQLKVRTLSGKVKTALTGRKDVPFAAVVCSM